jgi:predicted phage baseplate assembly protein
MLWRQKDVVPYIELESDGVTWTPRRDLLASGPDDTHFVAEVENDGTAVLRFARSPFAASPADEAGANRNGKPPSAGTRFTATYRMGNGPDGNVGAEALAHIVTSDTSVMNVRNPLPAQGGTERESVEHVRTRAPWAFRTQERAVTPTDYEAMSKRHPDVQRAAATFRWTGSWHTAFITADRFGGRAVDEEFERELRAHLETFRMAGYDLEIDAPRFVPLELDLQICVKSDSFRADVKGALLEVLGSRDLPDGRRGIFHPDNFTFGQSVHLSTIYSAAQAVSGVDSVRITRFQRLGEKPSQQTVGQVKKTFKFSNVGKQQLGALTENVASSISMSRLEIARLDNDRNFPQRGVMRLQMLGGK